MSEDHSSPWSHLDDLSPGYDSISTCFSKVQDSEALSQSDDSQYRNDSVRLSTKRYHLLVQDAQRYQYLRAALVAGGASDETLELLISTQITPQTAEAAGETETNREPKRTHDRHAFRPTNHRHNNQEENLQTCTHDHGTTEPREFEQKFSTIIASANSDDTDVVDDVLPQVQRYFSPDHGRRTLILEGITESVSLQDLTSVVRGGGLLKIYLLSPRKQAHVPFVDSAAADAFLEYSNRCGLFIQGKRVAVAWNEHQVVLPGHIINRVRCHNASRNLVIRKAKSNLTACSIEEDLSHIYQLLVISIRKEGRAFWIELNSIQHAITAKNCLQSQLKYRGSRIDFFEDQCNGPFLPPGIEQHRLLRRNLVPNQLTVTCANQFDLLSLQPSDTEE